MIEEFRNLRKELGKFKMSLLYVGIGLCILIAISIVILDTLLKDTFLPVILVFAVFVPCVFLVILYYIYLGILMDMKQELKADEAITPELSREVLINSIKEVKNHNLDVLEQKESELARLKKKVHKTSNPFLIRKYLKEKLDFEWESFQVELFIEFLNRDIIDKLKKVRDVSLSEDELKEMGYNPGEGS